MKGREDTSVHVGVTVVAVFCEAVGDSAKV
jgi:hypothetical protein